MSDATRDQDDTAFEEFEQAYDDDARVLKRGVAASSLIVKKYKLETHESIAFTSWEGKNRALTVFHFHPAFPKEAWRDYMERHTDGIDVLHEAEEARGRMRQEDWEIQSRRAGVWRENNLMVLKDLLGGLAALMRAPKALFSKLFAKRGMSDATDNQSVAQPLPPLRASKPMRPLPSRQLRTKSDSSATPAGKSGAASENLLRFPQ